MQNTEDDDDDFYGGGGTGAQYEELQIKPEEDEVDQKMEDEDGEDESDDDVEFTLEKPEGAKSETQPPSRTTKQETAPKDRAVSSEAKTAKTGTPVKQEQRLGSTQPTAVKGTFTHDGKEGKDFPEIKTSKIDVDGMPVWPATGKPITELDIDADLAENSKPWRLPGTDQTDFFNYGFDEYTWAQYSVRQQTMSNTISEQKQADAQMKAMFGGSNTAPGGPPGMPPGMPPMPGMPAMPSPEEMMQQMMQAGLNPADQNQFMQFMMSSMGDGQQNQQQQSGGFGQQRGGFGGSNQGGASPHPQAGQGYQPPQGPQGDQGGFPGNMDGYSAQQLAIMQQQQQGGMGGQGGGGQRRGRGRGRGYY